MNVIYVLLPVALMFAAVALYVFVRAVRAGQFDDTDTPAVRILHDDEDGEPEENNGGLNPRETEPQPPGAGKR